MRTLFVAIALCVLALTASPLDARAGGWHGHGHGHGHWGHGGTSVVIGVPPFWWGRPAYYYAGPPVWAYGPYPPYPPYPAVAAPRAVVEEPPVYVERDDDRSYDDEGDARSDDRVWYYCESKRAYYPNVKSCPEDWIEVPPRD